MKVEGVAFRVGLLALALASALWGFRLMFVDHLPTVFRSEYEDLSYGWYIPLFSLYVLCELRSESLRFAASRSFCPLSVWVFSAYAGTRCGSRCSASSGF